MDKQKGITIAPYNICSIGSFYTGNTKDLIEKGISRMPIGELNNILPLFLIYTGLTHVYCVLGVKNDQEKLEPYILLFQYID